MRHKILCIAVLLLGFIPNIGYCRGFNQKNDVQLWAFQRFEFDLNQRLLFYFENELRWGNSVSELFLNYLQSGVEFSLCKWLIFGPGYRNSWVLLRETRKRVIVYTPLLDIFVIADLNGWELENRVRTEYLIREPISDQNRLLFRYRGLLASPWEWGSIGFNPFVFDEVFFLQGVGFVQNRLAFGGSFELSKWVESELIYFLRHIRFPNWRPNHVLVCSLYFNF